MTKKIYIHIGCGKTGSSALQIWLNRISDDLKKLGINYPIYSNLITNDYEITSGNGVPLFNKIKNGDFEGFLRHDLSNTDSILLYSSEAFQNLTTQEIIGLKKIVEISGFEIIPIVFVRDIYPMIYSSYQQLIKRHFYCDEFQSYARSLNSLQQFDVLDKYEAIFNKIHVLHYDTLKEQGLDLAILNILGIDEKCMPRMSSAKVNRGLSISELEILKIINKVYLSNFQKSDEFSAQISNYLIYNDPEKSTEFHYDKRVLDIISNKFIDHVNCINKRYFNHNLLKVLNLNLIENLQEDDHHRVDNRDLYLVLDLLVKNTSGSLKISK